MPGKPERTEACVFCEIIAGTSPSSRIAENAQALAILTTGPIRDGHALVFPKRHVVEYPEATVADLSAVFALGAEVADRQRRALRSTGETLFLASGVSGGQSVFHLHLHVVPRHNADGLDLASWWEPRLQKSTRILLDATAAKLSGARQ
jgi:histidine triad (HIT) family protein